MKILENFIFYFLIQKNIFDMLKGISKAFDKDNDSQISDTEFVKGLIKLKSKNKVK